MMELGVMGSNQAIQQPTQRVAVMGQLDGLEDIMFTNGSLQQAKVSIALADGRPLFDQNQPK